MSGKGAVQKAVKKTDFVTGPFFFLKNRCAVPAAFRSGARLPRALPLHPQSLGALRGLQAHVIPAGH